MKLLYMFQIKNGAGLQSSELRRGETAVFWVQFCIMFLLKISECKENPLYP